MAKIYTSYINYITLKYKSITIADLTLTLNLPGCSDINPLYNNVIRDIRLNNKTKFSTTCVVIRRSGQETNTTVLCAWLNFIDL